jgi:uncharacterized membrane protein YhaH (DUF805 family)
VSVFANFKRLTQFSGREPRRQFWPYVALVYFADIVLAQFAMIPVMSGMMQHMMTLVMDPQFAAKAEANPYQAEGAILGAMAGEMQWIAIASMASGVFLLILLAAAVSRRLHDSGIRAWWGLLPLPFGVLHMALMPSFFSMFANMFSNPGQTDASFLTLFMLNNTLSLAAMITLIVLLCRRTRDGENAHGPAVVA